MSRRLFDTLKFDDPWYRNLTPVQKCFWEFLLSKCDIAGIWKVDFPSASWHVGAEINASILDHFSDRIKIINGGGVWYIEKFILFQQKLSRVKDLNPNNKCHLGILRILAQRGLVKPTAPIKGLGRGIGIGIGIGNTYNNNKSSTTTTAKGTKRKLMLFEELWQRYPRKLGKPEAISKFLKTVLKEDDFKDINKALDNFLASRQAKGDPKYIPHGATWFNNWQDWVSYIEPTTGKERENEVRESLGLRPKNS